MNEFWIYSKLGIEHILDPQGIDHMLFIITLCAVYKLTEWKKVAILVTAFTVGHSVTLALSSLDVIKINSDLIEILIPVTIILTALYNIFLANKKEVSQAISLNYVLALGFGLIHGMGFSNFFRAMMMGQDNIVFPLFSFNVGIEIGQLVIVAVLLLVLFLLTKVVTFKHKYWNITLSSFGGLVALVLLLQKFF
jgi:hypothetical protein